MEIEKNISFFVEQQFPAIYKENGPELVELTRYYYKFLEEQTNQAHYVSRRFFEYKDVDTTIKDLLVFFHKKFLADLPLKEELVPFLTKNILDLYRRKGSPAGIETFFSIFFNEYDIDITYPGSKMLKISNSKWRRGVYLQMFSNNNYFVSRSGKEYSYADLISKNITGSVSDAKAAVSRINFILIDGTRTPIIYIDEVQGNFTKYDDIFTVIDGEIVVFGQVNGSLNDVEIKKKSSDDVNVITTSGNKIGDILNVRSDKGVGGKVVVSAVDDSITGEIEYDFIFGGYGYTVENTRLLVSNQTLILENSDLEFVLFETLRDTAGNQGVVLGQSSSAVGVLMDPGDEFSKTRNVFAIDRAPGDALNIDLISAFEGSSPGTQFADDGLSSSVIANITNPVTIEVITDVITPHLGTALNAADYEATAPFSGTASPVNLSTPLEDAFDIQSLTMGKIDVFRNVSPGSNYRTQVFARAVDSSIKPLDIKSQIIRFTTPGNAGIFNVGEIITEENTNVQAEVLANDTTNGTITINPFNFNGFTGLNDISRSNGDTFAISGVQYDSLRRVFGDNAIVNTETSFTTGRISDVSIVNSGFGYVANTTAILDDEDGNPRAEGLIIQDRQGFTEGYWADYSSHLNGHIQNQITISDPILPTQNFVDQVLITAVGGNTNPPELKDWLEEVSSDAYENGDMNQSGSINASDALIFLRLSAGSAEAADVTRWNDILVPSLKDQVWFEINPQLYTFVPTYEYFNSSMRIQDSNFYQDYSYLIKSTLPISVYEKSLKENVHLAGTKLFGDFVYKVEIPSKSKQRFLRLFNDDGSGSALDQANTSTLEASVTNFTVDSTYVTADHEPGGTGGANLSASSDLTITKNWSQGFHDYEVTIGMPSTGSAPYPVAILLHGAGGSGAGMVNSYTNGNQLTGHVLIGVQGYENTWNISNEPSNGPDIEMLGELITNLKLFQNVDDTKIRIIGFSNGGALALRAAVEIDDTAIDVIVCGGSQTNTDQYRSSQFWYPADEELTGDAYSNDGYDTQATTIPQRRILQVNGRLDTVIPYNGGANFTGMTHLSAPDSAYAFALKQGYSGNALSGSSYGAASVLVNYGNVIFLNDNVGHQMSTDMFRLLNNYLENDYDITY